MVSVSLSAVTASCVSMSALLSTSMTARFVSAPCFPPAMAM